MALKITWEITQLEVKHANGLTNVATQACFDIRGEDDGLQGFDQGDVLLGPPDPGTFTDLSDVDEDTVVSWVKAALGEGAVTERENRVKEQIERARAMRDTPETIQKPVNMAWMRDRETGEKPKAPKKGKLKGLRAPAE